MIAKERISLANLLKIISGGQTGVDRGALDAALGLQVECGGWCPAGRLAEDGEIPERYPVVELVNAGYPERTARNVADSDGTLIILKGEPIGGTRETIERCVEKAKPYLAIDCDQVGIERAIAQSLEFIRRLSSRAQSRDPEEITLELARDPSTWLGMTLVLNVAGPRASQWPEGHKIAQEIVAGILRRLVDRTTPLNTVRDSPVGDP